MIQTITAYRTTDGKLFDDKDEAEIYQAAILAEPIDRTYDRGYEVDETVYYLCSNMTRRGTAVEVSTHCDLSEEGKMIIQDFIRVKSSSNDIYNRDFIGRRMIEKLSFYWEDCVDFGS
ncbi:hypothetical protein [Scytonema sp. NUACC26]|uniref:hypothetical protein n=1 Tax=Scytonema sp. NUACC26 TaxID=3140176 RepID=UPI0034DB9BC7